MYCSICGNPNVELHHIVFRSECKPLTKCKANHVYLCAYHHRGTEGVHGREGRGLDLFFKIQFQKALEDIILQDTIRGEEVKNILGINDKQAQQLLKTVERDGVNYKKESLIRACMGGKLYGSR